MASDPGSRRRDWVGSELVAWRVARLPVCPEQPVHPGLDAGCSDLDMSDVWHCPRWRRERGKEHIAARHRFETARENWVTARVEDIERAGESCWNPW